MLVLTRRVDEKIMLTGGITLTIVEIRGDKVRLGIEAPPGVKIAREEVLSQFKEITQEGQPNG